MADQPGRERRRKVVAATNALRDLRVELAVLNHRVGKRVELKDLDLDCLDVVARDGPISPSALADRVGVHLATMTGIRPARNSSWRRPRTACARSPW